MVDNRPKGCIKCFQVKPVTFYEFTDIKGEPFVCYFCADCLTAFNTEKEKQTPSGQINQMQELALMIKQNMALANYKADGVTIIK